MKPRPSTAQAPAASGRRRPWTWILPLLVGTAFLVEVSFLFRLDLSKNAAAVESWWAASLDRGFVPGNRGKAAISDRRIVAGDRGKGNEAFPKERTDHDQCERWLEKEDAVTYSRDFAVDPVRVSGARKDFDSCAVECEFGSSTSKPDANFGSPRDGEPPAILRSMESSHYYAENSIDVARGRGFSIVMTTSLRSDVPVGYFSWAEYDIMAPVGLKTEPALAAAFISNCGARNFRLQALEMLETIGIKIDSYGSCHRNRDGSRVNKVDALKGYKFSLSFENSNEEDYVTEKFFQSLVAGTIPVVIGPPNILDFAPSPDSFLHIKVLDDVPAVAERMQYLASNSDAYNQTLRWKYEGPSDSFKALIDMAAVHSSCRLCIHIATKIQVEEEQRTEFTKRPCSCSTDQGTIYHVYVRERGRFKMESIFLRSWELTLNALESTVLAKFRSMKHVPIWEKERPASLRSGGVLKIYRIYPIGITQRQALYEFKFRDDAALQKYITEHPCAKLEVIFV